MIIYVIVFAFMAALFFGLRAWGKKPRQDGPVLPRPTAQVENQAGNTGVADNLEFLGDLGKGGSHGTKGAGGKGGATKGDNDASSTDDGGGGEGG